MKENIYSRLPGVLPEWYRANRRDLPWRRDREPYHVWVSEIMLQQTRVEAVKGYYIRFLEALPTVADLASCGEETLSKLWEGLGYYSRMRNMQKAARVIAAQYGGNFPRDYEKILALPGVGAYTAGAICSICFDQPTPAVDGNVIRVASRLTGEGAVSPEFQQEVRGALAKVYPREAGEFTQALMELGATVCTPGAAPACGVCPCREFCLGRENARNLPARAEKKPRREENLTLFILSCDGSYALEKRPDRGLLASMWQFPNIPGLLNTEQALKAAEEKGFRPREIRRVLDRKHVFTHVQWNMRGFYLETAEMTAGFAWRTAAQIDGETALPTAFRQFWKAK